MKTVIVGGVAGGASAAARLRRLDEAGEIILLERGGCLKPYFSQFEQKEMRARLKALLNSPNGKLVKNMVDYVENMIAIVTVLVTAHS